MNSTHAFLTFVLLAAILNPLRSMEEKAMRPNILFIFADDQTRDALGAFGSQVKTPHLDRLVEEGIHFSQAYNQGSWTPAVCIASRTMLNTGRYLWHARRTVPLLEEEQDASRLWAQIFAKEGYETYFTGKWHVAIDPHRVFEKVGTEREGMPHQVDPDLGYLRPQSQEDYEQGWKPWDTSNGGYWEGGRHWSVVVGDEATGFLGEASSRENPFFMYLAFNAPHDPRQSPREYVEMYPVEDIQVPENFLPEYPYKDAIGCSESLRDERLAPFPRTEFAVQVHRQEYYAIISHMDFQIGRILDALDRSGKADNTYVIFSADHGLAIGRHGLIGKQNMFEHSLKVPLIITGPGIEKGKQVDTPVYIQDILPTSLDLAGIPIPEHVEFKSMFPQIKGVSKSNYRSVYSAYLDLQRMVRKDQYKLIYYPKIDKRLLYDLEADPLEMNDLGEVPDYAATIEALMAELQWWQRETGDCLEID